MVIPQGGKSGDAGDRGNKIGGHEKQMVRRRGTLLCDHYEERKKEGKRFKKKAKSLSWAQGRGPWEKKVSLIGSKVGKKTVSGHKKAAEYSQKKRVKKEKQRGKRGRR